MNRALAGRLVISAVAGFTAVIPYVADWNETHIFNPRWTPHAKFHNAQTMAFAVLLGVAALVYAWAGRGGERGRANALIAGILAGLYWATQLLAHLYPGVAYVDPEFAGSFRPMLGLTPQALLDLVLMAVLAGAVWLAQREGR